MIDDDVKLEYELMVLRVGSTCSMRGIRIRGLFFVVQGCYERGLITLLTCGVIIAISQSWGMLVFSV